MKRRNNHEVRAALQIIATLLESSPNRFGKLEFYGEDARAAVSHLQNLAVKYRIGECATVLNRPLR